MIKKGSRWEAAVTRAVHKVRRLLGNPQGTTKNHQITEVTVIEQFKKYILRKIQREMVNQNQEQIVVERTNYRSWKQKIKPHWWSL